MYRYNKERMAQKRVHGADQFVTKHIFNLTKLMEPRRQYFTMLKTIWKGRIFPYITFGYQTLKLSTSGNRSLHQTNNFVQNPLREVGGHHRKVLMDKLENNGFKYVHALLSVKNCSTCEEVPCLEESCTLDHENGEYMLKGNKSVVIVDGSHLLACINDCSNFLTDATFNWRRDTFRVKIIRSSGKNSKHFSSWEILK